MRRLSKSEIMHLVINDLDKKRLAEKEKFKGADVHTINNISKIKEFRRKKR
ncbi:hypothetical protein [Clostridium sp.]|uniref:hypothetical protein n=1 Tax=Clostridium sp. TaxID=1506 RepID=UPI00290A49CE|nr:hypothetical protein [Clostridium sp.]MDU4727659.1 hypothetical protein [Clostridium sp.]